QSPDNPSSTRTRCESQQVATVSLSHQTSTLRRVLQNLCLDSSAWPSRSSLLYFSEQSTQVYTGLRPDGGPLLSPFAVAPPGVSRSLAIWAFRNASRNL